MWVRSLFCLFCLTSAFADDVPSPTTTEAALTPNGSTEDLPKPIIKFLHYDTDIQNRYATTLVSSNVANPANKSQEVHFGLVLPETAFISGFVMIIKNKEYNAYVKEKEKAKHDYDAAVAAGQSAAHIQQDVRDSNRFQVSVNVEAEGKVLFKLTYEELLSRTLGLYKNVVNVNPGQIVKDLVVKVNVKEPVPITHFSVPKFRTKNEIASEKEEDDKLAVIEHNTKDKPNEASVTWSPSTEDQIAISKDGLKGQLVVEYDVSREKSSQILLDEGYFVHFFTPNQSAPSLPKHAVFVLDISGSMNGRKIDQLKEAIVKILSDLNEKDYFSIILFSSDVIVWSPTKTPYLFNDTYRYNSYDSDPEIDSIIKKRDDTEVLQANPNNIEEAKKFVKKIFSTDATNIMGGLREGIELINKGLKKFSKESNKVDLPQPIIIFLTDGEPNVDISDPNEIVKKTVELNEIKTPIFSLAFGDGADLQFLRRLSLKNFGFARNIYEASDAALQLNNFYKEISSPLMAEVNFSYLPGQVKNGTLTIHHFPVIFRGSEIVIAGKLDDSNSGNKNLAYDFSATKNSDGSVDYKGPDNIIIDFIPPIPRPFPVPEANKTFGHLEKLWGYLTIKQLLDKDTSDKNDPKSKSPEKEQALQLALKYSFVTPLTSLVVVKPNETDSNVNPEKASASPPSFGYGGGFPGAAGGFGGSFAAPALMGSMPLSIMSSGASYSGPDTSFPSGLSAMFARPASGFAVNRIGMPASVASHSSFMPRSGFSMFDSSSISGFGNSYYTPNSKNIHIGPLLSSRPFTTSRRRLFRPKDGWSAPPNAPLPSFGRPSLTTPFYHSHFKPAAVNEPIPELTTANLVDGTTTSTDIPATGPPEVVPNVQDGAKQIPVSNITWLANYTANHDHYVIDVPNHGNFTVGFNETDTLYGDCNVPNQFAGHCRHLQYCTLSTFVNTIEEYVPYFCPITNGFAGVCCPPNL